MKAAHYITLLAAGVILSLPAAPARASSHAEAPLIAEDPKADNTDVYFFRSSEDPSKVVILANYIPLEEPSGGPTYFYFSDRVTYEINVHRNGDRQPSMTFAFSFHTKVQTPDTFLSYTGPITTLTKDGSTVVNGQNVNPSYNRYQTYNVTLLRPNQAPVILAHDVIVPPNNAGSTTTPNFSSLVTQAINTIPNTGIRTFAGQIDDPFFIDLGAFFDLLRVRPFRSLHVLNAQTPLPDRAVAPDTLSGFNCHTIAMEIPITYLTGTPTVPGPADSSRILGVWASALRPQFRILQPNGPGATNVQPLETGNLVQVSRLGEPLVNELFLPLTDPQGLTRDFWNSQRPSADAQFTKFFQFPEPSLRLAQLYPALRGVVPDIKPDASGFTAPRTDLTGGATPLLNFANDLLRLDVSVPVTANPNRLGVIGGDNQGFPNGRRLADDVTDIYMRAAAGALVPGAITVGSFTGTRGQFLDSINFGDGVDSNDNGRVPFKTTFPFVGTAHNGTNQAHVGFDDPEHEGAQGSP